jgi:hypothetical protein
MPEVLVHSNDQVQLQLGFLRGYPQHERHGFNGLPIGAYSLTQLPGRWLVQAWSSGSLVVHWFNAIALGSFVPPGRSGVVRHGVGNLDPAVSVSVLTRSPSLLASVRIQADMLAPSSEAVGRVVPLFSSRPRFLPTRLPFSPLGMAAGHLTPNDLIHRNRKLSEETLADKIITAGLED